MHVPLATQKVMQCVLIPGFSSAAVRKYPKESQVANGRRGLFEADDSRL